MTESDESAVKEQLEMVIETMTHSGQTEPPEYFEKFDIEPGTARRLLAELAVDDDTAVTRYPQDGDRPDEFGPPGEESLSERQVQDRVMRLVPDMDQPRPVSWFVEQGAGERDIVTDLLENLLNMDELETYGTENGEALLGPPGFDSSRTTVELLEPHPDEFQLGFPDGQTERASVHSVGDCAVAATRGGDTIAVFVDAELVFTIDEYIKVLSPLSRTFAISERGHLAYVAGEHRENVLHVRQWDGEHVLQRVVDVSRPPSFTPDGQYVGHWRLTDHTVYIYDLETGQKSGSFGTDDVPGTNIGVTGVEYDGQPAFEITDTTGKGTDNVVAYLSPEGERLD